MMDLSDPYKTIIAVLEGGGLGDTPQALSFHTGKNSHKWLLYIVMWSRSSRWIRELAARLSHFIHIYPHWQRRLPRLAKPSAWKHPDLYRAKAMCSLYNTDSEHGHSERNYDTEHGHSLYHNFFRNTFANIRIRWWVIKLCVKRKHLICLWPICVRFAIWHLIRTQREYQNENLESTVHLWLHSNSLCIFTICRNR